MATQLAKIHWTKVNPAKAGKLVVKSVPSVVEKKPRTLGKFKGQITVSDDFDDEDEEINKLFYG